MQGDTGGRNETPWLERVKKKKRNGKKTFDARIGM